MRTRLSPHRRKGAVGRHSNGLEALVEKRIARLSSWLDAHAP
jgi:hypothetical protein